MDFCQKQVRLDCEELLSRFQRTGSVRFHTFSRLWTEMSFSHVFYGTMKREKRMFSRLALDTACTFFLPPFNFQIRVGGLYLLYSLYHCQNSSPPEQIRLALKDWDDVRKFERDAANAQHLDAIYILRRLLFLKAFHFTAMPTLLAYKKKRKAERLALCEGFMERACRPQELISMELLEELSNIHEIYDKLKTSVPALAQLPDASIGLIRKDLVPQLRSTVMDFYKWQQRKAGTDAEEDKDEGKGKGEGKDEGEGTTSQQESSRRAKRLASIKSKAYGQAAEASKSRRHRQVELDSTSGEAGTSDAPGSSRISKPSLKARTNENVHISGDVWKEAETTTLINRLTSLDSGPEEKPRTYKKFKW